MANSVWALTKPWTAVELSAYSRPCHCNNDSDSCHYQEEEKLKLGCESAFSRKPNITEEQQTGRRLMWTMGLPWRWTTFKEKTVGVHGASSKCFLSSLGRMITLEGFCSTMLSPSTEYSIYLTSDSKILHRKISSSFPFSTLDRQNGTFFVYICCAMANSMLCLFSLNSAIKPDFRALTQGQHYNLFQAHHCDCFID